MFLSVLSSEQITVDEDTGKMVAKADYNSESRQAKRMLQKEHKRTNRKRNVISLDEMMGGKQGYTK